MYCRNLVYLSVECGGLFEDETGSVEITDFDGYGNIPATGHKAGTAWKSDGNSHWNECENCGNKMNEAVHTFEWVKDKDGSRHETCTVCGYVKTSEAKTEDINTAAKAAKTGDDSKLGLWLALAGVSVAGIAACGILGFKKKKKEDN